MLATRPQVLNLFRRIMRSGRRDWKDPKHLRYIREEIPREFRENKDIENEEFVQQLLKEATDRIEIANHYKIPFPRRAHTVYVPQNSQHSM